VPTLRIALAAAVLAFSGPAWGGGDAPPAVVHPLLFNSDQNVPPVDQPPGLVTSISASSPQGGDQPEDAFGNGDGAVEPDTFIFADGGTADSGDGTFSDGDETVDFLEWTTESPVGILGYHLVLTQLDPAAGRTTQLVRFIINGVERDSFDNDGATGADNATILEVSRPFGALLTGSIVRIELTRTSSFGPRIHEIDALTESFCGNTTVEGEEQCDDGKPDRGDGCDAACLLEAGCPPAPDATCVAAAKASLVVNDSKLAARSFAAAQGFASATTQGDFGNSASGSTCHDLCIYDPEDAGRRPRRRRGGRELRRKSKPCWKDKAGKGWSTRIPTPTRAASASSSRRAARPAGQAPVQAGNNAAKDRTSSCRDCGHARSGELRRPCRCIPATGSATAPCCRRSRRRTGWCSRQGAVSARPAARLRAATQKQDATLPERRE
jgi:cysteine-rich repeat protein